MIPSDFDLGKLADIPDPLAGRSQGVVAVPHRLPASPTRRSAHLRRAIAFVVACCWIAGWLVAVGLRPDAAGLPVAYLLTHVALPYVFAAATLAVALHGGAHGLGLERPTLVAATLVGPLVFALTSVFGPSLHPTGHLDASLAGMLVCFDTSLIWVSVPLVGAIVALPRVFPVLAGWRAALVGSSAGLLVAATINLVCANSDAAHVLVGHGLPLLVATLVGALVVGWRARP